MAKKGFAALKKIKEEQDAQRAAFSSAPLFTLKDGESATVIFNGVFDEGEDGEEPFIVEEHGMKQGNNFTGVQCSKGHWKCVACYHHKKGDSRVSGGKPRAYFNVVDTRWIHKIKDQQATDKAGRDRFKYLECSDDVTCKYCRKKIEREHAGQKRAPFAASWANAIAGVREEIQKRCKSCGRGKLKLIGFKKVGSSKLIKDPSRYDPDELPEGIEKVMSCSKCDKPEPTSLMDVPILVKRTGGGQDTSYSFLPQYGDEVEEWVWECEPVDLEKVMVPPTQAKQAEKLGLRNPYDDDDDGEEAEEYDDEEEEDDDEGIIPKKSKKAKVKPKSKGVKLRRHEDDEEDDDDEDSDEEE